MPSLAFNFDVDNNAPAALPRPLVMPEVWYWPDYDKSAPRSPWGPAQRLVDYKNGIIDVSTAGHGGMKVTGEFAKKIPKQFRQTWYEEDCEVVIPLYFLYDEFKAIADQFSYEDAGKYGFLRAIKRKSKEDFKAQLLSYGCYAAIWDFIHGLTRDASSLEGEWQQREYTEKMADLKNPVKKTTGKELRHGQAIRFKDPIRFTVDGASLEIHNFTVVKDGRKVRFSPDGHNFLARICRWQQQEFTLGQ